MRRLYNAVCTWIEADAASKGEPFEPQPEGNNFTHVEHAGNRGRNEMHGDSDRQSIDDDDGGSYRLGFNNQHRSKL